MSGTTAPTPRVVVVEDHHLFAESLVIVLQERGYDASRVPIGGSGSLLPAITAAAPHLVVLDLGLGPAGDGMQLVAALRASGAEVIVLTGATEPARHAQALQLGAASVISKSTSVEVVLGAVRAVLAGRPHNEDGTANA